MKKRRKISYQKTFSTISAGFILACCIFYGYRFISLYLENKKSLEVEDNTLAKVIKKNNKDDDTFKNINNSYYFSGNTDDNYITYSNMLWRIVKVNDDNSIKLISDDVISYLAFDDNINTFEESYIGKWLNDENDGVFTKQLDKTNITIDKICTDDISKTNNSECQNYNENLSIGLLSVAEYVNAGAEESYLNNSKFYYLSSINKDKVWYVNSKGKLTNGDGNKLYGIRPTITLKGNIDYNEGKGTIDNPYVIKSDTLFASYVKLGNDMWRVYETSDDKVKLVLNDYLKVNDKNLEHIYSNKNYYHNDANYGSLAYYLNKTYLSNLSYSNTILQTSWSNGLLDTNFDYKNCINTTIDTKVAMLSIGDIILNNKQSGYFLMSGNSEDKEMVYVVKENGSLDTISVDNEAYVVPTIAISKDKLTKGNGSLDEPYEME